MPVPLFPGRAALPRPREPEGNGVAERFIRRLQEQLLWVQRFGTVADRLSAWYTSRQPYSQQWLVAKHNYCTPTVARHRLTRELAA